MKWGEVLSFYMLTAWLGQSWMGATPISKGQKILLHFEVHVGASEHLEGLVENLQIQAKGLGTVNNE